MGSDKTPVDDVQEGEARVIGGEAPAPASTVADADVGSRAEASLKAEVSLKAENAKLTALIEEYRNEGLRARADYDNLRKRTEREKAEYRAHANEDLIKDLIDVYENLERALDAMKMPDAQLPQLTKGLEMVYVQMKVVLNQYGLKPIDVVGKKFDPRTMEAMMQEVSDKEEDTVLEEFQRGYTLSSKIIRCSKVKVSKR